LRKYQISIYIYKQLTDFGGPFTSKSIQATSNPVHHSSLETSFKKGRIAFTALSAVEAKVRSITILLGGVDLDIFVEPAKKEQEFSKTRQQIISD
jgi:hypothetical protein